MRYAQGSLHHHGSGNDALPLFLALALAFAAGAPLLPADAVARTRAVRATAEMSMVLSGSIEVAADGSVRTLVLDQRAMLAPGIVSFVEGAIRGWQFEPTLQDGKPVAAHAPLRVRLRGKEQEDGNYQISMTSVDFSEYDPKATDSVTRRACRHRATPRMSTALAGRVTCCCWSRWPATGPWPTSLPNR